jgi:hypothetical protein
MPKAAKAKPRIPRRSGDLESSIRKTVSTSGSLIRQLHYRASVSGTANGAETAPVGPTKGGVCAGRQPTQLRKMKEPKSAHCSRTSRPCPPEEEIASVVDLRRVWRGLGERRWRTKSLRTHKYRRHGPKHTCARPPLATLWRRGEEQHQIRRKREQRRHSCSCVMRRQSPGLLGLRQRGLACR